MKKLAKKLALHKETLTNLDRAQLGRTVRGGTSEWCTFATCGDCEGTLACAPTDGGGCTGSCGCTANAN